VSVPVESIPKYQQLAPKFKEMREAGKSIQEITFRHKVAWQVAWEIIQFAEIGERPTPKYAGWEHFAKLAPLVADLREQDGKNWPDAMSEIARQTGQKPSTATTLRGYEHAHQHNFRIESGVSTKLRPRSGHRSGRAVTEI
jgi:hypothetical protein